MSSEFETIDFRTNLIVDTNNPILLSKACRDRYYGMNAINGNRIGQSYLGAPHGEDALTWNVFRYLEKLKDKGGYDIISKFFNVSEVQKILFWGCDVEHQGDEQQILNCLIRKIDGLYRGNVTEPDIIIITKYEVIFVEIKLNGTGSASPWKSQGNGASKRMNLYRREITDLIGFKDWEPVYQLIRNYVYAVKLAEILDKTPKLSPLVNDKHLSILKKHYSNFHQHFKPVSDEIRTWNGLLMLIRDSEIPTEDKQKIIDKMENTLMMAT